MGNTAGELHHLDAALHFAARVGEHLAVLGGDERREVGRPRLEQLAEAEQDAGAAER